MHKDYIIFVVASTTTGGNMLRKKIVLISMMLSVVLILGCNSVNAFKYKDEPYFSAYIYGDNHVERGEETQLTVVLQNNAILRELIYYNYETYVFLKDQSSILTTAYNVSIEFDGVDGIRILTGEQRFPAIQAMRPLQIPLKIRVENIEAGEYSIKVKLKYEIIDDLFLDSRYYTPAQSTTMKEIQTQYEYDASGNLTTKKITFFNETNLPTIWYDWIKYDYDKKEQTITLKIVVEEEDVRLEIVDVKAENMIAGGKGTLTLTVRNVGEKTGKNLYVILSTPSGFTALSTFQKPSLKALQPLMSLLQMQAGMSGMESPTEISIPPELTAVLTRGSYYIGDLEPGKTAEVTFIVDISAEEPGFYPFQLQGIYLDEYGDVKQTSNIAFGVKLKESVSFDLINSTSSVHAGSKGDFTATIMPSGEVEDLKARLEVKPPLTATVGEVFLGDVSDKFDVKFKVKAISDAEPGIYPAKIKFTYNIGEKERTEEIDAGIVVYPKMRFEVEGVGKIPAGKEETITAIVTNAGDFKIRDATARITVVDPFSTTDDTAYIGDLELGQSANVTFKLKVDKEATPKLYALNLEVKYKDISDEWVISEPEKMPVEVVESSGVSPIMHLSLIVLAAIAYIAYRKIRG